MTKAIEVDFPFEELDKLAEAESWRKEVHRPIYHIHKWWANRLGSVFRAIVLGTLLDEKKSIWKNFYKTHDFNDRIVLDPFMGSGTTLGEALKLGAKVIGNDINPISTFQVIQALRQVDIDDLHREFAKIERDVKDKILEFYKTKKNGKSYTVLYAFWVKEVEYKKERAPLFSTYIFSKNAYTKKHPETQVVCPKCWNIFESSFDKESENCPACKQKFNPHKGTTEGQSITFPSGATAKIKELVSENAGPLPERLFALMAVDAEGNKSYFKPDESDLALYTKAESEFKKIKNSLPVGSVEEGHNTNQALGYNYRHWRDFFNKRQLLCLNMLMNRIREIEDPLIQELFLCLFSSTLEFNNMFCSFKGEGTGAVRHMFSNHILKPERTPLENNIWGTPQSSGTFSTLFTSRLIRAKRYLLEPTEIAFSQHSKKSEKLVCSRPINTKISFAWDDFKNAKSSALLSCGDSAHLNIPDDVADAVVTDPPYFDYVHYSELSDFFYSWLTQELSGRYSFFGKKTTRASGEVQHKDPAIFSDRLGGVFAESMRVLKPGGILAFSFHHSKPEGWWSIYRSLRVSGFRIVNAHPIFAEMSVGNPKSATSNPILIDAILVCKKLPKGQAKTKDVGWEKRAMILKKRANRGGRQLTRGDEWVIDASQILVNCSLNGNDDEAVLKALNEVYDNKYIGIRK